GAVHQVDEVLPDRNAAEFGISQDRLHQPQVDRLAGISTNDHRGKYLLMDQVREIFRLDEIPSPVDRIVVVVDGAEQPLLRLHCGRRNGFERSGERIHCDTSRSAAFRAS
ncbi:hypothetical protein MKK70_00145, partial [Methylobacterium sp. E-041]